MGPAENIVKTILGCKHTELIGRGQPIRIITRLLVLVYIIV